MRRRFRLGRTELRREAAVAVAAAGIAAVSFGIVTALAVDDPAGTPLPASGAEHRDPVATGIKHVAVKGQTKQIGSWQIVSYESDQGLCVGIEVITRAPAAEGGDSVACGVDPDLDVQVRASEGPVIVYGRVADGLSEVRLRQPGQNARALNLSAERGGGRFFVTAFESLEQVRDVSVQAAGRRGNARAVQALERPVPVPGNYE